jgi:hypothetical protein
MTRNDGVCKGTPRGVKGEAIHEEALVLSEKRLALLRAVLERIIPADDFAGACAAGVDEYVIRLLRTDGESELPAIRDGLDGLEAEAQARTGKGFCELAEREQDDLLKLIEAGDVKAAWGPPPGTWFMRVVAMAMEGYYSDPGNGGNRGEVSWKMIGYDPGASRHV